MNVIALDIAKSSADCYLKTDSKTDELHISNDVSGCLNVLQWIKQHRLKKVVIAMEATGIYYETIANYLSKYHQVSVINPLKIKSYGASLFNRTKTDRADAKLIAEYAFRHQDKLDYYTSPEPSRYKLGKLIALESQLQLQLHQEKNRLHASTDEFVQIIHCNIIANLTEQLERVQQEIKAIILQHSQLSQTYQNLLSITGIGEKTAMVILHYLTCRSFSNANKFVAFAGLAPKIEQSGESVNRKCRLSRLGHKRLKSAFFLPALVAYRCNYFPDLVENLQRANKPKMVIITAIMRKLAKICYYIYKSGKPFDAKRYQRLPENENNKIS